jgi:hypothetical protein
MDVRGGLNYYHNVTDDAGHGLTRPADVGIPGANLDEFTSGIRQINIGGSPTRPRLLGQPAWDRWEKTWNVAARHAADDDAHVKFGGEFRKNTDVLLQTQDAGGPRGELRRSRNGTAIRPTAAIDASAPTPSPRSCSTGRPRCSAI